MKKNHVITLCALTFLAGDWEAIVRSNKRYKARLANLRKENDFLMLQNRVAMQYINDLNEHGQEYARARFNENVEFINLVKSV